MLPEGLDRRPLSQIATHVSTMGFNCVRLTWATYMFTRYANMTVGQSFGDLGLTEAISGLASNNPNLLSLNLVDARKAVVEEIGRHGIMMVLDNHVSKPMWCCGDHDGNSFFGSVYFDPDEWLQGLAIVANIFKDTPMVVGMSLRNELRGPLQNVDVWYKYVEKGAKTINTANPNLLVIISGLSYDLDFRFLKQRPLKLKTMKKKVVYETHRYAFTEGQSKAWVAGPLNKVCHDITREMEEKEGFLVRGGNPLFVSEFGINQMGNSEADNRHLPCMLSYLADLDLDWSVWALQGSYYLRDRHHGPDETYGMFTANWTALRNPNFLSKLQFLQQKFQDPKSSEPTYHILYHPLSGRCARVVDDQIHMSDCLGASRCIHEADGMPIQMIGSLKCLAVVGEDLPLNLSTICNNDGQSNNTWSLASNSMFQLANRGDNGLVLCLDFDSSYSSSTILTRKCVGLEEGDMRNPQTQWFKLIASNTK
nr:glycosyl hydrolase 5 family protein-like [Ipomoea batatas]